MRNRNTGTSEDEILQNEFTAYLLVAVQREKKAYLEKRDRRYRIEVSVEDLEHLYCQYEADFYNHLPLMQQIENLFLLRALIEAGERDRYIFLAHVLGRRKFAELGAELGISHKAVSNAYYRFIERLRRPMKEVKEE